MRQWVWPFCGALLLVLLSACGQGGDGEASTEAKGEVHVFAAASTAHVVESLARAYEEQHGVKVRCNAAASSTLARQIEQGAPADMFLSANVQWMDHLEKNKLIDGKSRRSLLGNRLVLVMPASPREDAAARWSTTPNDIATALSDYDGRLVMGDPAHVPAGQYAKAALESLGLWDRVGPLVLPMRDVRAALLMVERGEVDMGIVYATDAKSSSGVKVVTQFPESAHARIDYPVALTTTASDAARRFYDFLRGAQARQAFAQAGFIVEEQ